MFGVISEKELKEIEDMAIAELAGQYPESYYMLVKCSKHIQLIKAIRETQADLKDALMFMQSSMPLYMAHYGKFEWGEMPERYKELCDKYGMVRQE